MSVVEKVKKVRAKRKEKSAAIAAHDLVWRGAHTVTEFYGKTYPCVFAIPWQCHDNEFWRSHRNDGYAGAEALAAWCTENCTKRFRWDYHRVSLPYGIGSGGHVVSDYVFDEMGGGDVIFFAFEDNQDFCFFSLRWSHVAS